MCGPDQAHKHCVLIYVLQCLVNHAPVWTPSFFMVHRGGHLGGGTGVQNVPRSAWVKTDAASRHVSTDVTFAVLLAASVLTHALRGTYILYPSYPPPLGAHLCISAHISLYALNQLYRSTDLDVLFAEHVARLAGLKIVI